MPSSIFDLTKFHNTISHLKIISPTFNEVGDHYIICCPYCDDATRKNIIDHGHLYISKTIPVFYCHRCDTAGSLLSLLNLTEFNDDNELNNLKQVIKFKLDINYLNINKYKSKHSISDIINSKYKEIPKKQLHDYYEYLDTRIGKINYSKFLLFPEMIKNKITVGFFNYENEIVSYRFIKHTIRYHKMKTQSNSYFFQPKKFDNVTDIIITEGQFDLIKLYLYNEKFNQNKTFYISSIGKNYTSCLTQLLHTELLLNSYTIHLVFDADNYKWKSITKKCKYISTINPKITIIPWVSSYFKDANDCPELKLLKYI